MQLARYGDRLERAFHNAAAGALNRDYTRHVYYQSANLAHIPVDFREYGNNISRRWELHDMHTHVLPKAARRARARAY